ncbi:MAG: HAD family hydrolase [Catenulispora sp.]
MTAVCHRFALPLFRGLIVDFVGVLTTSPADSLARFCRDEGLPADTFIALLGRTGPAATLVADLELGTISQVEFNAELGRLIGVSQVGLVARLTAALRPQEAVLDTVATIRESGVKVAVLSNSWGLHPHNVYERWELETRFDDVVYSELVGLRKPDPAIYVLAAQRLGLPPEHCVFVDDTFANLAPAHRLGMGIIHQTDPSQSVRELTRFFEIPAFG